MRLNNKLLWVILVVFITSVVTYLLGLWPVGLAIPAAGAWMLLRHYDHIVNDLPRYLLASSVPMSDSYHIDYEAERQRTEAFVSEVFPTTPEGLGLRSANAEPHSWTSEEFSGIEELKKAPETERDQNRRKVANLLRAGKTDRRTIAKTVFGADTKSNRDEVDELIMEIVERTKL